MSSNPSIIGFRQDRVGARIVGVLNVMRLSRKFDVGARFQWLSQPDGPYPELADPALFFTPAFIAAHIDIVSDSPAREGLRDLGADAAQTNEAGISAALARGARFYSDAAFDLTLFQGEDRAEVARQMRAVRADLELAAPLARALRRVGRRLRVGGKAPTAIHVRRGDILDGDPWSYTQWPSKFLPDEFLRAFAQAQPGPVIAFSDTPAAVGHLAQGSTQIIPVDTLLTPEITGSPLSQVERDVLELLLMSRCDSVGSASSSAFSRAAQVVGGCRVVSLPAGLPSGARHGAYDLLLERVIAAPDSFFAPGDLAQSTVYAAAHAVHAKRVPELLAAFEGRDAVLDRFPFLLPVLAQCAQAAGIGDQALALARRGLDAPRIRSRDRVHCRQIVLLARAQPSGDGAPQQGILQGEFIDQVFAGRGGDTSMTALGHAILSGDGRAGRQLMFPPQLVAVTQQAVPARADRPHVLPSWTFLADWEELLATDNQRRELRRWPDIAQKLHPVATTLATVERALAAGVPLPEPDDAIALHMGFAAGKLALHGRLRRAFAILTWLEAARPGEAITAKRLADAFFQAGNRKKAWQWLDAAMLRAPDNALLQLSAAVRAHAQGFPNRRADHLAAARRLWPELEFGRKLERRLLRQPKADKTPAAT